MTLSRRRVMQSVTGLGVGFALSACSNTQGAENTFEKEMRVEKQPFTKLPQTLLVNRERATKIMNKAGIAAIICSVPRNIYYTTNYFPILSRMGMPGHSFAVLPADPRQAPVLIEGEYAFYIAGTESFTSKAVDLRLFTAPTDPESFPSDLIDQLEAATYPSFLPTQHNTHALSLTDKKKRDVIGKVNTERFANSHTALVKAILDMGYELEQLAVDDSFTKSILSRANILNVSVNGENMLRQIRLQKSTAEIELMKFAANANAEAGLAAAKLVRDGASFVDVRKDFFRQCSERLLTPSFMVIDGVAHDMANGEIEDGRAFLIDCVSHHQNYYGDYGRTVCVGEPTKEIAKATQAMSDVWDDLLPRLRPGVKYNEIGAWALEVFEKTDSSASLICNPHSVGLQHTDEPSANETGFFVKDNLELMEGMIISVDLPMIDVGLGGSAHLEDLVLIKSDGAELLNSGSDRVIVV